MRQASGDASGSALDLRVQPAIGVIFWAGRRREGKKLHTNGTSCRLQAELSRCLEVASFEGDGDIDRARSAVDLKSVLDFEVPANGLVV